MATAAATFNDGMWTPDATVAGAPPTGVPETAPVAPTLATEPASVSVPLSVPIAPSAATAATGTELVSNPLATSLPATDTTASGMTAASLSTPLSASVDSFVTSINSLASSSDLLATSLTSDTLLTSASLENSSPLSDAVSSISSTSMTRSSDTSSRPSSTSTAALAQNSSSGFKTSYLIPLFIALPLILLALLFVWYRKRKQQNAYYNDNIITADEERYLVQGTRYAGNDIDEKYKDPFSDGPKERYPYETSFQPPTSRYPALHNASSVLPGERGWEWNQNNDMASAGQNVVGAAPLYGNAGLGAHQSTRAQSPSLYEENTQVPFEQPYDRIMKEKRMNQEARQKHMSGAVTGADFQAPLQSPRSGRLQGPRAPSKTNLAEGYDAKTGSPSKVRQAIGKFESLSDSGSVKGLGDSVASDKTMLPYSTESLERNLRGGL